MKVILYKDIEGLGEEGDIKEVANGYARNYLLPKKLALPYNKENLKRLESMKEKIEKRKEEKRREALSLKERLETEEVTFTMPASEGGKLFGSVNNSLIAQELAKRGYEIDKKRIEVPDQHLRMVGNYSVKIKLYDNEYAMIKVSINPEEAGEKQEDKSK